MCRDHGIDSGGQLVDSDPLLADVTQPDLAWYLPLVRHHLAGSRSGQAQNTLGTILLAPDSRRAAQIHSTATDCLRVLSRHGTPDGSAQAGFDPLGGGTTAWVSMTIGHG